MAKSSAPLALCLVLLMLPLAGCLGADDTSGHLTIRGSFTTERTQENLAEFDALVRSHGVADYALMESWPEQFLLDVPGSQCQSLLEALQTKSYIGTVSGCAPAS